MGGKKEICQYIRFFHGALQLNGSAKEANIFHNSETEKSARKVYEQLFHNYSARLRYFCIRSHTGMFVSSLGTCRIFFKQNIMFSY